jgi:hypothetical protein
MSDIARSANRSVMLKNMSDLRATEVKNLGPSSPVLATPTVVLAATAAVTVFTAGILIGVAVH